MDKFLGIRADVGTAQIAGATQLGAITTLPNGHTGLASFDVLSQSHNRIEHDASFTRNDVFFTPEPKINATRVKKLLSFSSDNKYLTPLELAQARHWFIRDSFTNNPSKTLGKLQTDACWRENGLIQLVIGWNEPTGKMRVDWLKQWFLEERLPFNLGWKPSTTGGDIADATNITTQYIYREISINAADPLGPLPLVFQ
ncbi:hypothetical protein BJ742DRAFT_831629 [Cladochytrium replicatum]|nr:hypothetical protein BJ742DRAFT_831629 [Cladochytrium replicatum]